MSMSISGRSSNAGKYYYRILAVAGSEVYLKRQTDRHMMEVCFAEVTCMDLVYMYVQKHSGG